MPPYSQAACRDSEVNTDTAWAPSPSSPSLIGSRPSTKAIGARVGASSRSAGRTHSPQAAETSTKHTP
ncbi:hypothetical protein ACZ90_36710 [Streptomyces albus subsp. albus]|nr:hypothetical protein ACZ90_36710 [Streptomyces albus subsp. albus]